MKIQASWDRSLSIEEKYAKRMKEFKDKMTVQFIWTTNVLEETLPDGVGMTDVENALSKAYKDVDKRVNDYIGS